MDIEHLPFDEGGEHMSDDDPPRGMEYATGGTRYEVDSLIQMADDYKEVRHGPVFEDKRDARWYKKMADRMHIPAWITPVKWGK